MRIIGYSVLLMHQLYIIAFQLANIATFLLQSEFGFQRFPSFFPVEDQKEKKG